MQALLLGDGHPRHNAAMECVLCTLREPEQQVIFRTELVAFLQDPTRQGALRHSGIIIPIQHRETVFDLTKEEMLATFQLLKQV